MQLRRLLAIGVLILMGGILAACGSEDEEDEPTAVPATEVVSDEEDETEPTEPATEEAEETEVADATASAAASPAASPVSAEATAEVVVAPATPVESTPVTDEDTDAVVPVVSGDEEAESSPEATEVPMTSISGVLTLDGRVQQDFTLSDEGCVGLGEWRQLEPGTQVIVRDASGTVVDVSALEAQNSEDVCSWTFAIDAPAADYFSVSIPMVTEVWFDQNDPAVQSGELELFVP